MTGGEASPCIKKYEDGKKEAKTLVTTEQLQKLLKGDGRITEVRDVYVDVKHLYIETVVKKDVDTTVYFSCDIGQETSTLRVETGLSNALNREEVDALHFVDGNQCVFYIEDDYEHKCYDFRTGEVRELEEEEPEFWWQYYNSQYGDYDWEC